MIITYSLSQLHTLINQGFKQLFGHFCCRIQADISTIKPYKDRRYLTLIEPGEQHHILASIKGIIFDPSIIQQILDRYHLTPEMLIGKTIQGTGRLTHHTQYGTSFVIESLEITDQSVRVQHTLAIQTLLQQQGIYNNNRGLPRPLLVQRIAIITGEGSEGCRDVLSIIEDSPYRIECQMFYCAIHGNEAAEAVSQQLDIISNHPAYDVVMIVRGGGDSSGFSRQDNAELAQRICRCPIPVVVAIGHTSNTSLLDEICHTSAKTPSDAAYRIISSGDHLCSILSHLYEGIQTNISHQIISLQQHIEDNRHHITTDISHQFSQLHRTIDTVFEYINAYHPSHLLSQGYSIISDHNNQIVSFMNLDTEEIIPVIIRTREGTWKAHITTISLIPTTHQHTRK